MTKEELFEKYSIDESHSAWNDRIDNWYSVEVYRRMHDGNLPPQDGSDESVKWVTDFLDKFHEGGEFRNNIMRTEERWGSLYLTAKNMVYRFSEQLLKELP